MFWDKISPLYDLFENIYNRKVFTGTGKKVAEFIEPSDIVLECACGTGTSLTWKPIGSSLKIWAIKTWNIQ